MGAVLEGQKSNAAASAFFGHEGKLLFSQEGWGVGFSSQGEEEF